LREAALGRVSNSSGGVLQAPPLRMCPSTNSLGLPGREPIQVGSRTFPLHKGIRPFCYSGGSMITSDYPAFDNIIYNIVLLTIFDHKRPSRTYLIGHAPGPIDPFAHF
jgi:hypothetical protein